MSPQNIASSCFIDKHGARLGRFGMHCLLAANPNNRQLRVSVSTASATPRTCEQYRRCRYILGPVVVESLSYQYMCKVLMLPFALQECFRSLLLGFESVCVMREDRHQLLMKYQPESADNWIGFGALRFFALSSNLSIIDSSSPALSRQRPLS